MEREAADHLIWLFDNGGVDGKHHKRRDQQQQQQLPKLQGLAGAIDRLDPTGQTAAEAVAVRAVVGELQNPIVPVILREYFESYLEPPDASRGERPCLLGRKCTAYDIPKCSTTPGAGPLKEFRVPGGTGDVWADVGAKHMVNGSTSDRMPCISCIMQSTTQHVLACMLAKTEPGELLQLFQVLIADGEFCVEDCHPPQMYGRATGAPYPTPRWDVTKFAWDAVMHPDGSKRARVVDFFRRGPSRPGDPPPRRPSRRPPPPLPPSPQQLPPPPERETDDPPRRRPY